MGLKLALRSLLKTPYITGAAVISLALGIGATTAIFSLYSQVLLRSLPVVQRPSELVNLANPGPKLGSTTCGQAGDCNKVFSYPMFRDLEQKQTALAGIATHVSFGANLSFRGQTLSGQGLYVSGGYFPLLGLSPALGRLLSPRDDAGNGESRVAVLSHEYWGTQFAADPGVINQTLIVNGQSVTIVGIAPEGFDGTSMGIKPQIFVPVTARAVLQPGNDLFSDRFTYWAYVFGRLKPDVSIVEAQLGLNVLYSAIINDVEAPLLTGRGTEVSATTVSRFKSKELQLDPGWRGQSTVPDDAWIPLNLLFAVTLFLLLIVCVNIVNLMMVRAAGRQGEIAIRLSLGARARDLVRQLLTESVMLSAVAGIAALFVARWTLQIIASYIPAEVANTLVFRLDLQALVFAVALPLLVGVLVGIVPAIRSARPDLLATLKGEAGQIVGARNPNKFRTALVTTQIAISLVLLMTAGLLSKSLLNVTKVDLGLNIDRVITFGLSPDLNGYNAPRTRTLFDQVEDELKALPGVSDVSASTVVLLDGSNWNNDVSVEGYDAGPDGDYNSSYNLIGPNYFETLGIPLLAGREFTRDDGFTTPRVAVVNEQFARKFRLGRDVVGKRMKLGRDAGQLNIEIVGVVKDAAYSQSKNPAPALFFQPYRQRPGVGFTFYVRSSLGNGEVAASIRTVVARIDSNLPIENLRTMTQQFEKNTSVDRLLSAMSTGFALVALLVAAVGLYGVLAYSVAQRTREIGLRMAIGARPSQIRLMILRQVGWVAAIGGGIGWVTASVLGRLAGSLLFEIKGDDPAVLFTAAAVLGGVVFMAALIPAYRASQVDPLRALRYE